MIRTIVALIVLFFATFFLPFWLQVVLYVVAILTVRHRIWLLLPALFADLWYSPVRSLSFHSNKTILLVFGMLVIYFVIVRNTRVTQTYGLSKK